jgi:hypothetical protein
MRSKRELDPTNYLFQRRKFYDPNRFSPLLEIAIVLVRFNHVARVIVKADHSIMRAAAVFRVPDSICDGVWPGLPQPPEWQQENNQCILSGREH